MRSLELVKSFSGGDFTSDEVLAAAVLARCRGTWMRRLPALHKICCLAFGRSFEKEIILLILTSPMAAWGLNFVLGLHKLEYGHYLIASQTAQHCRVLGALISI